MELICGNISRQLPQIGILVQYLFSIATKKDLLAIGKNVAIFPEYCIELSFCCNNRVLVPQKKTLWQWNKIVAIYLDCCHKPSFHCTN